MTNIEEMNKIIDLWFYALPSFRNSPSHKNVNTRDIDGLEVSLKDFVQAQEKEVKNE